MKRLIIKNISIVIAVDISEVFDNVWHNELQRKRFSFEISVRVLSGIKSFVSGRSIKIGINGQSSESQEINAVAPLQAFSSVLLAFYFIITSFPRTFSDPY